jgi:hypothetical protein
MNTPTAFNVPQNLICPSDLQWHLLRDPRLYKVTPVLYRHAIKNSACPFSRNSDMNSRLAKLIRGSVMVVGTLITSAAVAQEKTIALTFVSENRSETKALTVTQLRDVMKSVGFSQPVIDNSVAAGLRDGKLTIKMSKASQPTDKKQ